MISNIKMSQHILGVTGLLLASFFLSFPVNAAHPTCDVCHSSSSPSKSNAGLVSELPGMCLRCHTLHASEFDHSVRTKPTMEIPKQLPLYKSTINCTTCHDPHGKSVDLLRVNAEELCLSCH
ncbi:MAG: cytochrome c3 family protein [Gammaproteobacteria bacterium]|nr:cytochrome c3 family protein [Gammaproteobacteria bacterium]